MLYIYACMDRLGMECFPEQSHSPLTGLTSKSEDRLQRNCDAQMQEQSSTKDVYMYRSLRIIFPHICHQLAHGSAAELSLKDVSSKTQMYLKLY